MRIAIEALSTLALSFLFDLMGEAPEVIHPTVLMGKMERLVENSLGSMRDSKIGGVVLWLTVIITTGCSTGFLLLIAERLNLVLYILVSALLLKSSFALITMDRHVKPILEALDKEDLDEARSFTSKIVRRETNSLSAELLCSASVESVAEGLVDGVCSPLLFYALFGVTGAMLYRAVNTMDSMVGYKTAQYARLGWFSAKADTVANFLVSRLVALLTAIGAATLRLNWKGSHKITLDNHGVTESVNAGYPLSAFAGALNVTLEKRGHYLIPNGPFPNAQTVKKALTLMKVDTALFTILVVLPVVYLRVHIWWVP